MKVKKLKNKSRSEEILIDDAYQRGFEAGIEFQKEQELNKKFPPEKIICAKIYTSNQKTQQELDTWGLAD